MAYAHKKIFLVLVFVSSVREPREALTREKAMERVEELAEKLCSIGRKV